VLDRGDGETKPLQGGRTIARILAKGWIEVIGNPETYRITPQGVAALKAKIPLSS
jgi:hypothetical protein